LGRRAADTFHLTDQFARDAECPKGARQVLFRDTSTPAFALRVMRSGVKAWLCDSRAHGQRSLGQFPALKASQARVDAERMLEQLRAGQAAPPPSAGRAGHSEVPTLRNTLPLYLSAKASSQNTREGMTTTLTIYGAPLLDRPMAGITQADALQCAEAAWKRSARQGDLLRDYANSLYVFRRLQSPFAGFKSRYDKHAAAPPFSIPVDVWAAVLNAMDLQNHVTTRDVLWAALLTGFRPDAACHMRWDRLHLEEGQGRYFIAPDAPGFKGGASWHYPLPELLTARLRERRRLFRHTPWVFPARNPNKPLTGYRDAIVRIRDLTGLSLLTPYSLRDTRATYAEQAWGQNIITQRFLNHRPDYLPDGWRHQDRRVAASRSTGRYVETTEQMMRPLVERYADLVLELAGRKPLTEPVKRIFIDREAVFLDERLAA